jgi:hypothetical protein
MRRVVPPLIVLCLGFAPAPVYRERPDARTDLEKLQGEWERVSCSTNGDEETVVYRRNRLSCFHQDGTSTRWDVVLDLSKERKRPVMGHTAVPRPISRSALSGGLLQSAECPK